ncbi:MAG: guanylate kinase [Pseudomonadota bacterium]|nr:guanylate kinase [Pseudomonadota bacterium]
MVTGTLFIIAAPSGAGKTTLVRALTDRLRDIRVSVSHTTRPKRPREIEGVNYHFVSEQDFDDLIEDGILLEHANVFGHQYGTSSKWVGQELAAGVDVILEIDWQGAKQVKERFPRCVSIFILPPSSDTLRERLMKRAQDDPEVIAKRMAQAKAEMSHFEEFDYLVINQHFRTALRDLITVVCAERLRLKSQMGRHKDLIESLF